MVLLPGCACCGSTCKPCPVCADARCYKVTFSGFGQLPNSFSDCSDCRHLDDATVIVSTAQDFNPIPHISVSASDGVGATFSATFSQNEDRSLSIASISLGNGGGGYVNPMAVASGDGAWVVCTQPSATLTVSPSADPDYSLSIAAHHGSGATIGSGTSWSHLSSPPGNVFELTALGTVSGGDGYLEGDIASLVNAEHERVPGTARIDEVARSAPTVHVRINTQTGYYDTAYGDPLSGITLSQGTDSGGKPVWSLSSIPLSSPMGDNYTASDAVSVTFDDPLKTVVVSQPVVTLVIQPGAITGWQITDGGKFKMAAFTGQLHTESGVGATVAPNAGGGSATGSFPGSTAFAGSTGFYCQPFTEGGEEWYAVVNLLGAFGSIRGGRGYSVNDYVEFTFPAGSTVERMPVVHPTVATTGPIESFTIVDGGQFYHRGGPTAVTLLTGGEYQVPGSISSVTLDDGGVIWPSSAACTFNGVVCGGCPGAAAIQIDYIDEIHPFFWAGSESQISVQFTQGFSQHGLTVQGANLNMTATADAEKNADCSSITFTPSDGCTSTGTITVESCGCDETSAAPCPMPEQIALNVTWPAYRWQRRSSNLPGLGHCYGEYNPMSDSEPFDETYILDRTHVAFSFPNNLGVGVPCSALYGDYHGGICVNFVPHGNVVTATVDPPDAPPSWYPNQPASRTATAEVTGISGDQITAVTVTDGGAGYEYEIMERAAPTVTLTADESNGGSGAMLTATLQQIGTGDNAVWGIVSVAVANGGTGYPDLGPVVATVGEGQVIQSNAALMFTANHGVINGVLKSGTQTRRQPEITLTAPGGSGAVLTPTLVKNYLIGSPLVLAWWIDSVAVESGGSGYTDGQMVTFAFTDASTVVLCEPCLRIATTLVPPEITGAYMFDEWNYVPGSSGGTGASFDTSSLSLVERGSVNPNDLYGPPYFGCFARRKRWGLENEENADVSGIIVNGGSGYQVDDLIKLSFAHNLTSPYPPGARLSRYSHPYLRVAAVDEDGAIVGIKVVSTGLIAADTGVIESIDQEQFCQFMPQFSPSTKCPTGLAYIPDDTLPVGEYYAVEGTGQSHTSNPSVTIHSDLGNGATADATVSDDAVSSITVTNGGSGYSPQSVVWRVDITFPGPLGGTVGFNSNGYMCDGSSWTGRSCSCASPMEARVSDNCPHDLFGTYSLGVYTGLTNADLIAGPGCGAESVPSTYCAYWLNAYGIRYGKAWWLTGGRATISPVEP